MEIDVAANAFKESPGGEYCRIIYESGRDEVLDLERGIVKEDFLLVFPISGTAIHIEGGSALRLIEVSGKEVYFTKREGDLVEDGDIISYVVTKKGETRSIRADGSGIIAYIAWIPGKPERYIFALTEKYRVLRRAQETDRQK